MGELVFHIGGETWGRRHRQPAHIFGLIEQTGIDIRKRRPYVKGVERMKIATHLESHQQGLALRVGESHKVRFDHAVDTVQINVVVDVVGKSRGV